MTVLGSRRPAADAGGGRLGQHRRPRAGLGMPVGLTVALAAVAALVALPAGQPRRSPPGPLPASRAWPQARGADVPGSLPDGPAYHPLFFFDAQASIGTAPTPDGRNLRLVLRAADGPVRELRRLPMAAAPRYAGFTVAGDKLAWAESTADGTGRFRTQTWLAELPLGRSPRLLTADAGNLAVFESEYDMVIANGRLHWVVLSAGGSATQVRSVALTGGRVEVRTERGAWALTAWPWLVGSANGPSGSVQLRDLIARKVLTVGVTGSELATCSPAWCRVAVVSGSGPVRTDLMRPDGSDRRRIADGTATAAVADAAVLDRFELLSVPATGTAAAGDRRLLAYDIVTRRTVDIATRAGIVAYRNGVLWWSTGVDDTTVWHTLDLRDVTPP